MLQGRVKLGAAAWISLLTTVFATACAPKELPVSTLVTASDVHFHHVLDYLQQDMIAHDVNGAAIAVVDSGRIATAGVGYVDTEGSATVQPTTLFRVASLSKMVLAATTLSLDALDPSQPITSYVPLTLAAPFDPSSVTLQTLLSHTSGLPDVEPSVACPVGTGQLAAWFTAHGSEPLWSPPGQIWNYSNRGYGVIGWAIEAVTGQAFEDVVAAKVFVPVGMTGATYDVAAAMNRDHAVGHAGTRAFDLDAFDCEATRPEAGVIASVVDYAQLALALFGNADGPLPPTLVNAMEQPLADTDTLADHAQSYGDGLMVFRGILATMIHHNGHLPGYGSQLWAFPAQQLAIVVFYNDDGRDPGSVAEFAAHEYLGQEITAGAPLDVATSPLATYAGSYVDPFMLGQVSVQVVDGALHAGNEQSPAGLSFDPNVPLRPIGGDAFNGALTDGDSITVTFFPGSNGPAQWLATRSGVGVRQ